MKVIEGDQAFALQSKTMSVSIYLICDETEHYVHIGEVSSTWARGADSAAVVGLFSHAHSERPLRTSLASPDWKSGNLGDEWTRENAVELYRKVTGQELPSGWTIEFK